VRIAPVTPDNGGGPLGRTWHGEKTSRGTGDLRPLRPGDSQTLRDSPSTPAPLREADMIEVGPTCLDDFEGCHSEPHSPHLGYCRGAAGRTEPRSAAAGRSQLPAAGAPLSPGGNPSNSPSASAPLAGLHRFCLEIRDEPYTWGVRVSCQQCPICPDDILLAPRRVPFGGGERVAHPAETPFRRRMWPPHACLSPFCLFLAFFGSADLESGGSARRDPASRRPPRVDRSISPPSIE